MSSQTIWYGANAKAKGFRATEWTVGELSWLLGDDFTVFQSFGHVNRVEGFGKSRLVKRADGFHVVTPDGATSVVYQAAHRLRIITK